MWPVGRALKSRHGTDLRADGACDSSPAALNGGTSTVSAINDADAAVVLWRAPAHSVYSSVRATRTGAWRTLVVPSGAAARGNDGFFTPSAAMNAKGQATVVWAAHEQQGWAVRSAFRSGTNAIWRATPALVADPTAG